MGKKGNEERKIRTLGIRMKFEVGKGFISMTFTPCFGHFFQILDLNSSFHTT